MEIKVNVLAILVAVVVNFILGFIWYTPLFGKIWGKEMSPFPNSLMSVFLPGQAFICLAI
jgi:hypothetical protein